jgi:putative acetyltransferase
MTIRVELPSDAAGIRHIHELAFGREAEANLVDAIRRSPGYVPELSLVAEQEGLLVGHIMFSIIQVEGDNHATDTLALAPLAVLPTHQRQGVGSRLTEEGITLARSRGFRSVVVLGHPSYYPRFGFLPAEQFGILPPWGEPTPALMVLPLVYGGLDGVQGTVRYPPAFSEV